MNELGPRSIEQLRRELLEERERHTAALAQAEILEEELVTAGEQLAAAGEALALAREENEALRRHLQQLALERHVHERRVTNVLEASPTTLFEQDLELRYIWACASMFGKPADEVIGMHDGDLFLPAEAGVLSTMKREVLRILQPSRNTVSLTIGGSVRRMDVYLRPLEDELGTLTGICGIVTDLAAGAPG